MNEHNQFPGDNPEQVSSPNTPSRSDSNVKIVAITDKLTKRSVRKTISDELLTILKDIYIERERFQSISSEIQKTKRLMFLFQRNLIPGIAGQILEAKDNRDSTKIKPVSRSLKLLSWSFLLLADALMLFYVFLFAVSQDNYRQKSLGKIVCYVVTLRDPCC